MTDDTQIRLTLLQTVDQFSEHIVARTDKTLSKQQMDKLTQGNTQLKLGQLNNLLGVALETDSPAVVTNWVRYQMGRRETKAGWGDSGLGAQVVNDIEALQDTAKQISKAVFKDDSSEHLRQAHIALVRRYAGYLKRWFVAKGGQQ
jgi:hypothetical protein